MYITLTHIYAAYLYLQDSVKWHTFFSSKNCFEFKDKNSHMNQNENVYEHSCQGMAVYHSVHIAKQDFTWQQFRTIMSNINHQEKLFRWQCCCIMNS